MDKEFVPYTEALALKELGFYEPCFGYYENGEFVFWYDSKQEQEFLLNCSAPTWGQAFDFFREKYNLNASVYPLTGKFSSQVYDIFRGCYITNIDLYEIHEEAELACLKKLIEIVKNKNNEDNSKNY